MKLINTLPIALLLAGALTGCGTDDPAKKLLNVEFDDMFSFATTVAGDTIVAPVDGTLSLSFNSDKEQVSLSLTGVRTSAGGSPVSIVLNNVHCTTDSHGERVAEASRLDVSTGVSIVKLHFFPEPATTRRVQTAMPDYI